MSRLFSFKVSFYHHIPVVTLQSGATDLTLIGGGTVAFADETELVAQLDIVMATADDVIEGLECYTMAIQAAPTAAGNLAPVDTAEVCIIDTSCKYFSTVPIMPMGHNI